MQAAFPSSLARRFTVFLRRWLQSPRLIGTDTYHHVANSRAAERASHSAIELSRFTSTFRNNVAFGQRAG
jgi:hypothetical protein